MLTKEVPEREKSVRPPTWGNTSDQLEETCVFKECWN